MIGTGRGALTRWAMLLLCIVLGGFLAFLLLRYFLPILLPFLIAWLLSLAVAPPARKLAKRLPVSERICAVVLLLLLLAGTVAVLFLGVSRLTSEIKHLFDCMIAEYGSFEAMLSVWMGNLEEAFSSIGLFGEDGAESSVRLKLSAMLSELLSAVFSSLASLLPTLAGRILKVLPGFLFASVIAVISAFYFCIDRENITRAIIAALPRGIRNRIPLWRERTRRISWRYVKAYLLLMLLTFLILLIGFLFLRIPYALLLAVVAAVVDMLPVLGVGTVLLPWAVVVLLQKNFYLGFGLLILYGVCMLVRQIAEPRLVGKSLGLHPLLTVFATYVGWKLFGLLGMLLAPVFALVGKSVCRQLRGDDTNRD